MLKGLAFDGSERGSLDYFEPNLLYSFRGRRGVVLSTETLCPRTKNKARNTRKCFE
jgi:hypothetical protein